MKTARPRHTSTSVSFKTAKDLTELTEIKQANAGEYEYVSRAKVLGILVAAELDKELKNKTKAPAG